MESIDHNDSNRDELIMQQQREIEKEISESTPLVSELMPLTCLGAEYNGDDVFTAKIQDLSKKYKFIRRTRPDGNCFFRAFAYSYLEYLITNNSAYQEFQKLAESSKNKLVELGFPSFTLEDFHETFMEVIKRVCPDNPAGPDEVKNELHKIFNEQGYSDYVVVYLRLITSGKLQEDADFYQHFIEGDYSIEEFRHQEVEPMYKESDHIHIIALCTALGVGVKVEYLDRGEGGTVKAHDFPEGSESKVYLIYRPGHYDILYPN
ncbi:LOW QUALITY PROTEIN: ubiquitin thioesterase otubain-like [Drosophila busckii]|uniref:LOW QUALITY PROTEIN: ubiquitin thioesterase otubain-like n=1 Tax=Drosophila busckii TaxID=30019 RepID=UPI001432F9BE|nr:LOW QUALITY PROTEIN: ubiquitin thioesterase otubain-like [Drosophila busckii]